MAHTRELIHHRERPQVLTGAEPIGDKIHRPALVDRRDRDPRGTPRHRHALASPSAHLQACSAVDAMHALVVDHQPLAAQHYAQATVSKAPPARCKRTKALGQILIACFAGAIVQRRRTDADQTARPSLAHASCFDLLDRVPFGGHAQYFLRAHFLTPRCRGALQLTTA